MLLIDLRRRPPWRSSITLKLYERVGRPRVLIALATIWALAACAASNSEPSKAAEVAADREFAFSVGYYEDLDRADPLDFDATPSVFIALPILPGSFVGAPVDIGLTLLIDNDESVSFDFVDAAPRIERAIEPLARSRHTEGLVVLPAETRFARFGTHAYEPYSGFGLGRTGFLSLAQNRYLWLAFFDRTCSVRGTQTVDDGSTFTYRVDVPESGFYWLQLAPSSAGGHVVSTASLSERPVFGIEVPGAARRDTL